MPLQKGPNYINWNLTKPCKFQMSLGIVYFCGCTLLASSHSAVFENICHFRLLTRSGLTYPEVSKLVFAGSFAFRPVVFLLSWLIFYEAFCLHVAAIVFCSPVFCPKLGFILFFSVFCFVICPSAFCCFSRIFHFCLCYSSCVSCLNGQIFTTV